MANRLATLTIRVEDYETKLDASTSFNGEVVAYDPDLKNYLFRFFETDSGTLLVSIDYSKEKVIVTEKNDVVDLFLELELNQTGKCIYRFDANNSLNLESKSFEIEISEDKLSLGYDLYALNDNSKPLTKNRVEIICEGYKPC